MRRGKPQKRPPGFCPALFLAVDTAPLAKTSRWVSAALNHCPHVAVPLPWLQNAAALSLLVALPLPEAHCRKTEAPGVSARGGYSRKPPREGLGVTNIRMRARALRTLPLRWAGGRPPLQKHLACNKEEIFRSPAV